MAASTSCIGQITVLDLPKKERAMELMREVAVWVEPVMKKHGWFVPCFAERNFHGGFLGMNINGGQRIEIRLRPPHDLDSFIEVERLMDTMLHELSHNVHHNHSAAFYELWEELRKELTGNLAKGLKGSGAGFDAKGHRVNSDTHNPASMLEARRKTTLAAEKRLRQSQLFGSGPQKVGGSGALSRLGEAEAVRFATMRRCADWCGNREEGEGKVPLAAEEEEAERRPAKVAKTSAKPPESVAAGVVAEPRSNGAIGATLWKCDTCTFENDVATPLCDMCGQGLKPGVWRCGACTAVNSSLFSCSVCDAKREF